MIRATLTDPQGTAIAAAYDHENPDDGDSWLTKFEGWSGGVGIKGDQLERSSHGNFALKSSRTRRTLTLGLVTERDSRQELWELERKFSGMFADGGFGQLEVFQDGQTLHCEVELDGEPKISVYLDGGVLEAEFPLSAPLPWLYGPWQETRLYPQNLGIGLTYDLFSVDGVLTYGTDVDHQAQMWNNGNADSYPIYTVFADSPGGFRIRQGNNTIAWNRPTFMSTPIEVHMDGKVMVNDYDQSQYLTERNWAPIGKHSVETASFEFLQGGQGWCNLAFRDTNI